tara:strand:- start:459 stop:1463 length:1005 start_codon:yes stop_codon:yes gene_type:complete
MSTNRELSYSLAINEALSLLMEKDENVFILGQGVKSPWYVGNTCKDLIDKFGEERVIDTPVSENSMTGAAVGASLVGMKSIIIHPRIDFSLYAFDPIINQAANWNYMNGGNSTSPSVVFWLIMNRGGEQAAQHSQALHSIFAHIPGLKVFSPSNAYDVKGMLSSAINDPNPVVFIDDRWLYGKKCIVPSEYYEVPIGKGKIVLEGDDVTIVSSSYLTTETTKAAIKIKEKGYNCEVIDLRSIKPLDVDLILNSVMKTKKLVIVDGSWRMCSIASEISACISEKAFNILEYPVKRINLPDCPAPASRTLEEEYYINQEDIYKTILYMLESNEKDN